MMLSSRLSDMVSNTMNYALGRVIDIMHIEGMNGEEIAESLSITVDEMDSIHIEYLTKVIKLQIEQIKDGG